MIITLTKENAQAIGRCIIDEVLTAHETNDYALLTRHFSPEMKQNLTQEKFTHAVQEAIEPMGKVISREYLGHLKRVNEHQILWKVVYEHSDEEILWQLYLCDDEAPICVTGLWFS